MRPASSAPGLLPRMANHMPALAHRRHPHLWSLHRDSNLVCFVKEQQKKSHQLHGLCRVESMTECTRVLRVLRMHSVLAEDGRMQRGHPCRPDRSIFVPHTRMRAPVKHVCMYRHTGLAFPNCPPKNGVFFAAFPSIPLREFHPALEGSSSDF